MEFKFKKTTIVKNETIEKMLKELDDLYDDLTYFPEEEIQKDIRNNSDLNILIKKITIREELLSRSKI